MPPLVPLTQQVLSPPHPLFPLATFLITLSPVCARVPAVAYENRTLKDLEAYDRGNFETQDTRLPQREVTPLQLDRSIPSGF